MTLLDGGLEDENINRKYLERSEKSIDRLINIVQDLEEISKLESGSLVLEPERFDIVALVREIAESIEIEAAARHITFRIGTSNFQPPVLVYADRRKISQVIMNLLINSVRYGRDNGTTTVSFVDMYDRVMVEVADNGVGIAEEYIPRVFERFSGLIRAVLGNREALVWDWRLLNISSKHTARSSLYVANWEKAAHSRLRWPKRHLKLTLYQ